MKKDLHIANSVQALKDLAQKDIKNIKPNKLYNSAEKVFQTGLQKLNEGDEESAYILFVRFTLIYKFLEERGEDKHYTKQRLGSEHTTVSEQLGELDTSLQKRYNEQKKEEITVPLTVNTIKLEVNNINTALHFPSGYITCGELYSLVNKKVDMVILDSRPQEHYLQSSIKHPNCANIPEEIIQSGSSANTLGKVVPKESIFPWERRWKCSITVLLDWSSTKETITASKLSVLQDILIHWDTTMLDRNPPIILNGGYLEWLQMYPMLCTNPDVVYEVQNSVLNDLLNLDTIEYPSTEETVPARYLKPPSLQPTINRATKPIIKDKENKNPKNDIEIIDLDDLRAKGNFEAEEGTRFNELQQREKKLLENNAVLEKVKQELNEENKKLRKKLHAITKTPNKVNPINLKGDVREKLLVEAREKKKLMFTSEAMHFKIRSKVQEFTKQMKQSGKSSVEPGLTGLVNLGATCYMNSVIQCLSNTRILHNFFLLGHCPDGEIYTGNLGDVSKEFKNVFLRLWSGHLKYFSPTKFKGIVDRYGPRFKGREQQDAHEYLLSLNNWLHDDLKQDMKRPLQVIWTPKQRNWMACTEGKTSVILETFCGQQLNTINCDECKKKREKLELFENLTLALPSQGTCTLENCLNQYYTKQQINDYSCQTCRTNKLVNLELKLVGHPPVLVLCLKRFNEVMVDGRYNYVKNIVAVKYPLLNLNLFGHTYHLYGVIVHKSATITINSGHYYAICKNLWSGKWYKFDDQYVTEVNHSEALEPTDAYILFYQSEVEETLCRLHYQS